MEAINFTRDSYNDSTLCWVSVVKVFEVTPNSLHLSSSSRQASTSPARASTSVCTSRIADFRSSGDPSMAAREACNALILAANASAASAKAFAAASFSRATSSAALSRAACSSAVAARSATCCFRAALSCASLKSWRSVAFGFADSSACMVARSPSTVLLIALSLVLVISSTAAMASSQAWTLASLTGVLRSSRTRRSWNSVPSARLACFWESSKSAWWSCCRAVLRSPNSAACCVSASSVSVNLACDSAAAAALS
mmetsp:Transcript_37087/g.54506  ORF Transcript_37087/g.54506 Transcript_37087/m.54506 type:complete len:256 (-) Transcript_37087:3697-4464(-)